MGLRLKISLLIGITVLAASTLITLTLARYFVATQKTYFRDFQTTAGIFALNHLVRELDLLHFQGETLLQAPTSLTLADLTGQIPLLRSVQIRRGTKMVSSFPPQREFPTLAPGNSRWTLMPSDTGTFWWVGRYSDATVVLELDQKWIRPFLEASHGAEVYLVDKDGLVIASSLETTPILGSELFPGMQSDAPTSRNASPAAYTRTIADVTWRELLATFLALRADPPLSLIVSTPESLIAQVTVGTYRQAIQIGSLFLLIAIALGIWFARSLIAPLHSLNRQTEAIGHGEFDLEDVAVAGQVRTDEIGRLAQSFGRMRLELKQLRSELRKKERLAALGQFSAAVAHQIKNPLGGILMHAQIVRQEMEQSHPDPKATLESLAFVESEVKRASETVNGLMKFSRQAESRREKLDLAAKTARALDFLQPAADKEGVTLIRELPATSVYCLADAAGIQDVLLNLIQNAFHAVKDRPRKEVRVSLREMGDLLILEVIDTGCGIPPEMRDHLFEPFHTTKPLGEGTGLGLATCHGIVISHLGRIEVESEPEQGTRFTITLPAAAADAPDAAFFRAA